MRSRASEVRPAHEPPAAWLRLSTVVTLLTFPVYAGLAALAFWLRIGDYGLTPPRIIGLAMTGLAALYSAQRKAVEETVGRRATIDRKEDQPGDVRRTWADISKAQRVLGYQPAISIESGIREFVAWYTRTHGRVPSAGA